MDFNLDRLRSFIVVARTGSLSAAAKELGMTQPNLGRQMTALEKEVRLVLFSRHSRGLYLTKQGEDFLNVCKDIVGQIAQKVDIIREKESDPSGCLKIISGSSILERVLEKLPKFSQEFPNVDFSFSSMLHVGDLEVGGSDVALTIESLDDPEFIQLPLCDMALRIYASPMYLKSHGTPKMVEDLKSHKLVLYRGENEEIYNNREIFNGQLPDEMIENPKQFVVVTSGASMGAALISSLGIGCIAYNKNYVEKGLLIDVFPGMPDKIIPYYFTYHSRLEDSPKIKAFYDFLREEVANIWQRPKEQVAVNGLI